MATHPQNSSVSPFPYGTKEWHEWVRQKEAEEIAARPVTNRKRRPLTPEEFESYKPKP